MKKSSLLSLSALLALSVFLFTACPEEGGTTFTASTKEIDNTATNLGFEGTSVASSATDVATVAFKDDTKAKVVITSVKAGTATITVTATDYSPAIIPVTVAADGGITLGTITTGLLYSLPSGVNPTGLKIVSAVKAANGVTTITLGGTVTAGVDVTNAGFTKTTFAPEGSAKPTTGKWSWVTIKGILNTDALKADTVIKQTNLSLLYYDGSSDVVSTDISTTNPPTVSNGSIYIKSDKKVAYKLKKYTAANGAQDTTDGGFAFLLWDSASPKTATFEITPKDVSKYTVVVDWSGVTFN